MSGLVAVEEGSDGETPRRASAVLRFAIPSMPTALSAVVQIVRATMEWMAFEQDWIFRAELCLHEAMLNAHFHGNEADPKREIRVGCSLAPDNVEMVVEDDGRGYDAGRYSSPPPKGNPHGRGLHLIRQFMHSVDIHGDGRRIVMCLNKE
ncbi:MAG TPA: ATP-binding protein [Candidatus Binatia bacterium]|jgi:anti-sigma regulatory factor (Ser/Thr protein kinase)